MDWTDEQESEHRQLFSRYAAWDWVQQYHGSGYSLHCLTEPSRIYGREWYAEGRVMCGRVGEWRIPGLLSRMSAPRCKRCCDKVGIARGAGSPKNDPALREWLSAQQDGASPPHLQPETEAA